MSKRYRHEMYLLKEEEYRIPNEFRRIAHMAIEVGSRVMDLVDKPDSEHFYVCKENDSLFIILQLSKTNTGGCWVLGVREIQSKSYALRYHPNENSDYLKVK